MNRKTEHWIKIMDWCSKYWGCHQIPERSFFISGYQFPVCARCTGIIVGYIISAIYTIIFTDLGMVLSLTLLLPMAVDGSLQLFTNYLSNNIKRFITGLLAGFGFIQFIKSLIILFIT